jgi:hypothetical protein
VPPSFHQIDIYRRRAAEMELLAAETKFAQMRRSYLRLAEEWILLADSLEDQLRRASGLPSKADQDARRGGH